MPTYTYEILEDNGKGTEYLIEVVQSMKDDALTEWKDPEGNIHKVRRVITGGVGVIFTGGGWTPNYSSRGYKGKFSKKIRPIGTPVEHPVHKKEADRQFQQWVDTGGLTGIKPDFEFEGKGKNEHPDQGKGDKTQSAEQLVDKNYNPYK